MKQTAYCLFETALGSCGIAWTAPAHGTAVIALALPEAAREMTERRLARASGAQKPTAPPPEIAQIIARLRKHLEGSAEDFRDVRLDLEGADLFARQVYAAAREIPVGETRSYGEIAAAIGQPTAAQEVGKALARNPIALIVPCHRVVAAGGKPGGFSAHGGLATKATLLAIEGAAFGASQGQRSFIFPAGSTSR
jgi:methylated-DNA-[protein]-cysteine S-methyltransferase